MSQIIRDRDEIRRLFRRHVQAYKKSVTDCLWFREALTDTATPFVILVDDRPFFLWEFESSRGHICQLWGGRDFITNESLDMSVDQAKQFLELMPGDFEAYASCVSPVIPSELEGPDFSNTKLHLSQSWSTFHDYELAVWSGKRRRNMRHDLKPLMGYQRIWRHKADRKMFDWLMDRDANVAIRHGDDPMSEGIVRSMWDLFQEAEAQAKLVTLEVWDGLQRVAAEMFIEDYDTGTVLSVIGHGNPEYDSSGKLLYALVIERAIEHSFETIDAMNVYNDIKKAFGYLPSATFWIDIPKERA